MRAFFEYIFLIVFSLLPVIIVDGSHVAYFDAKIFVLLSLILCCSLDLLFRYKQIKIPFYVSLLGLFAFLRILLFGEVHNVELLFNTLTLATSSFIIGLWIFNSRISEVQICLALLPGILCSVASFFSMYFYRYPLFSSYSAFGAPIGLKNSLSVYLAQTVPFLLIGFMHFSKLRSSLNIVIRIALSLAMILSLWVIIANRTRSAWWMLLIIAGILVFVKFRKVEKEATKILPIYLISLLLAILLTIFVPNKLIWKSSTPYLDSLTTLVSPSASNGRIELWSVGLEIIKSNPFWGIGSANYPILWQSYITAAGVNPKTFMFLRPDLPIFNDFLQSAIENGLATGLIFTFIFLIYPIFLFFDKKLNLFQILLITVCLITSVDAFFDYPFNRPESLLNFIIAMTLFLRSSEDIKVFTKTRFLSILFVLIIFVASQQIVKLGQTLYLRRAFEITGNVSYIERSISILPWYFQWNSYHLSLLLRENKLEIADKLANSKVKQWPNDPDAHLMLAMLAESKNEIATAEQSYIKALNKVENGLCYSPAYRMFSAFMKKYNIQKTAEIQQKLNNCQF
jgi:O-antigen ligase